MRRASPAQALTQQLSVYARVPDELWERIVLGTWDRPVGAPDAQDEINAAWAHVGACRALALTSRRLSSIAQAALEQILIVGESADLLLSDRAIERKWRGLRTLVVDAAWTRWGTVGSDASIALAELDLLISRAPVPPGFVGAREIVFAWDDFEFEADFGRVRRLSIDIFEGAARLDAPMDEYAARWGSLRALHLGFGAANGDFVEQACVLPLRGRGGSHQQS